MDAAGPLLALAWLAAGRSPWALWSLLLGLGQAASSLWLALRRPPGVQVQVTSFLALAGACVAAVLGANAAGVLFFERSFAGYLIGLLWLVTGSALFFARLVYLGLSGAEAGDGDGG